MTKKEKRKGLNNAADKSSLLKLLSTSKEKEAAKREEQKAKAMEAALDQQHKEFEQAVPQTNERIFITLDCGCQFEAYVKWLVYNGRWDWTPTVILHKVKFLSKGNEYIPHDNQYHEWNFNDNPTPENMILNPDSRVRVTYRDTASNWQPKVAKTSGRRYWNYHPTFMEWRLIGEQIPGVIVPKPIEEDSVV